MMTIGQLKSNDSNPDSAFSSWFFNHTELLCPRGCCVCVCGGVGWQVFIRKLGINKAFISTIANVSPSVVTLVALLFYTAVAGAGNAPFAPFYPKNDRLTKTGSGQTQGKHSKREIYAMRFSHAGNELDAATVFTSIALFENMKDPLSRLPDRY
jgi:hypothetical protein